MDRFLTIVSLQIALVIIIYFIAALTQDSKKPPVQALAPTPTKAIDKNVADELKQTCYYNTGSVTSKEYKSCYQYMLTH